MAATLLHTFTNFGVKRLTLTLADTAYKVVLPNGALTASVRCETNDGRYQSVDVAMGAADDWLNLPAGSLVTVDITRPEHGHPGVIYLASGTAGTVVEVAPSATKG